MNKKERKEIKILIDHCDMLLFGSSSHPFYFSQTEGLEIARKYNLFCLINLVAAMFLIKDRDEKDDTDAGGVFYRLLKPMGYDYLLDPIKEIMKTPIGETTFGNYQRLMRNRLCTHGDFSRDSLPEAEQNFIYSKENINNFYTLLDRLTYEVEVLRKELEKLI